VLAVKEVLVRRWWVVDADIEGYFDNVDHEILMGLCRRRISDRRVLKLIDQWLRAGVMIEGHRHETRCGVPQGGVISPLLANIYLHTLDRWWSDRHADTGQLHRYCDDFVIVCRSRSAARRALERVTAFLGRLKLTLHPGKTRVVDLGKGRLRLPRLPFPQTTLASHGATGTLCVARPESDEENVVGKPYEGEPHVRLDVAGGGDQDPGAPGASP
jgi:group II intron reverse transcriptase/maturase